MAVAIPALLAVSTVAALAGTAVSVVGQLQAADAAAEAAQAQGQEAARAAEANAAIARQQAEHQRELAGQERHRAAIEASLAHREAVRRQGGRVAAVAASGLQLGGSALDVIADAAHADAWTRALILAEGEQRAQARLAGATVEEMTAIEFGRQAEAERQVGGATARATRRAGTIGAFGTILGGVGSTALTLSQSPTISRGLR